VESVAFPDDSVIGAFATPSIVNVTLPDGVPLLGEAAKTLTVNVIFCPKIDGFELETSVVFVFALFTVCVSGELVLDKKFPSPEY
jgi:hypothetical protein